jgi:hypothetical protein
MPVNDLLDCRGTSAKRTMIRVDFATNPPRVGHPSAALVIDSTPLMKGPSRGVELERRRPRLTVKDGCKAGGVGNTPGFQALRSVILIMATTLPSLKLVLSYPCCRSTRSSFCR